jgi:hypothetical protein
VSSKQAGLLRRGPRTERQLGLVLLGTRIRQVREDLRNHLRLLDAGNDLELAATAHAGRLKELADRIGAESYLSYPGRQERYSNLANFLIDKLQAD